jgi:hypothetical protein
MSATTLSEEIDASLPTIYRGNETSASGLE